MKVFDGYEVQAQLLKVLSHPVRLEILNLLAVKEACVCHLETILGRPQPYVSKQLGVLRDAGLVSDRREGTLIYYRVADEHLSSWLHMGRMLVKGENGSSVDFPGVDEEVLERCPCPRCQV